MAEIMVCHGIVVLGQEGHQSLGHSLGEIEGAKLCGSQHLYAKVHQLVHLILQHWKI
jgi:hypothetical protein